MALIKHAKLRFNPKIRFPRDTKQGIHKTTIINGCNTQVVHILSEEHVGDFIFKRNILRRLPEPVELSHEWVLKIFKYQELEFMLDYLMSKKKDILNFLQAVKRNLK